LNIVSGLAELLPDPRSQHLVSHTREAILLRKFTKSWRAIPMATMPTPCVTSRSSRRSWTFLWMTRNASWPARRR
jgi:hypothetical protein